MLGAEPTTSNSQSQPAASGRLFSSKIQMTDFSMALKRLW
jgi:hypothetical protein